MAKVRWGIISTARIGMNHVIPGMQKGSHTEILGIASADGSRAAAAAERLNIPRHYGSYAELLADADIDAVYIPLPNHLHVEWAVKALQAGKHVLCEKPIGMNAADAERLLAASRQFPRLKVMEAFMYRFHPQWKTIRSLITDGGIGELKYIDSIFTYHNANPADIRNTKDTGGGGLLDIGCYCISLARYVFGAEPLRVFGNIRFDARWGTDVFTSGILEFPNGRSTFTCSTQLAPTQHAVLYGTTGKIDVAIPFNPLLNPTRAIYDKGSEQIPMEFEPFDQYTAQGDAFSLAILQNEQVPTPLSDAVANMKVIDGVFDSARAGTWITIR